jgi:hypothetical protein
MNDWKDGIIEVDSDIGKVLGFTSDRWIGWLWLSGDKIFLSYVEALHPGQGHLHQLRQAIEAAGYRVAVPIPLYQMREILRHWGFSMHMEKDSKLGNVEIWEAPR